jgi:hypothetical protein
MKIETKKQALQALSAIWIHAGSARDNDESVDCDSIQETLHAVGEFLEKLWEVDFEGDSVKYGAAIKEPHEGIGFLSEEFFEEFLVREDGTTNYERRQKPQVN